MTVECTTSADAITSVLLAGDVLINASGRSLNTTADAAFLVVENGQATVKHSPEHVSTAGFSARILDQIASLKISRIVLVCHPNCADSESLIAELALRRVPVVRCLLADDCGADAFMDDEESEAVAERLRQLGYL